MKKKMIILIIALILIIVAIFAIFRLYFYDKPKPMKELELTVKTMDRTPFEWEYEIGDLSVVKLEKKKL